MSELMGLATLGEKEVEDVARTSSAWQKARLRLDEARITAAAAATDPLERGTAERVERVFREITELMDAARKELQNAKAA